MTELFGYAVVGLVFGVPLSLFPYRIARLEERIDAIGSKRSWGEVEPAGWKVFLNRALGVVMTLFGVLVVGARFLG